MINAQPRLNAQSLAKSYGKTQALDEVTLDISSGGVIAILGQNGAGKTTFIRCALGLVRPSGGSIKLFGHRVGSLKARRRIGVMLQDSDLPDLLTARELLILFASYYPEPLNVDDVLTLTDIESFADKRYTKLSGGQKRRVQFALSTIGNPDILFLDEPTTGLDIEARKALWQVVRRFASEGKAIILTTHYLEEADALADRIILFANSKVIADAPAAEIRMLMGGSLIRCQTVLSIDKILELPACVGAEVLGQITTVRSNDPVVTLRALLAADANLSDLTVTRPNLDDIFSELTA